MATAGPKSAALITGALGGIGQALCAAFRDAGYYTLGIDLVDEAPASATCDAFLGLDLADLAESDTARRQSLAEIRAALGERPLAVLLNNAAAQVLGGVEELSAENWQQTLSVNLLAPFFLIQGLLDRLTAANGSVINLSSIHANLTKPGFVAYATSKAAIAGLTRAMAVDLGPRVRVNAIAPAAIETEMLRVGFGGKPEALAGLADCHPVGRLGRPEEVARLALFLASAECRFLTGSVLGLDGAISARLHDPV